MTLLAWISALISVPFTFAVDTALAVGGKTALALGFAAWLAGLMLVLARPRH
jgi:hypothetical protein